MTIGFEKRLAVPTDVLVQELGGESVLLNLNGGRYFGLDEVGTRMWQLLTTSPTIEAAYRALLDEYDVDANALRSDLGQLIDRLVEHGLVEVGRE
jgi:hypothetical protein